MRVERTRRLANFWSWLPAFRAVAEKEHLPSAADELFVSPSALSRSVRHLEEQLGVALFERQGRGMVLSEKGRELLNYVRKAMRLVDDGVEAVTTNGSVSSVRVATPGPFTSLSILPALRRIQDEHPKLVPTLLTMTGFDATAGLLSGAVDLALVDDPVPEPNLVVERLATVHYGVYCGPGHPLYASREPTRDQILMYPFAVPTPDDNDHFPVDVSRRINAFSSQAHLRVELCAAGSSLAMLPESVARHRPELRALPFEGVEEVLYAVYRAPLDQDVLSPARILLMALRSLEAE